MKRILCLFLLVCLVFTGCSFKKADKPVAVFYYSHGVQDADNNQTMVVAERREISPNATDLRTLLSLYLVGPLSEDLVSPFRFVRLLTLETEADRLNITLGGGEISMTDIQFHLACACMTLTCLELVDVDQVTISLGSRTATMSREDLVLIDTITPILTQSEDTP